MKQPLQPLYKDSQGTIRFRPNAIVRYLIDLTTDTGSCNMNILHHIPFSDEDREQFAQLIGYSVNGFGELSYVSDETFSKALRAANKL